jgi:hypothetical protein
VGVLMFGYVVLAFACLSIGYLGRQLWKQYYKQRVETHEMPTPDILSTHEHPMTRMHHDSGPHPGCDCRVCVLQRRNFELELAVEKLRHLKRV